ncbi:hypothetical protein [Anatilimnocola floriformis]|uniref:hypothetical protein n=1 Tax=Anatilimnocola floriformis TaxID=2948575 RepID=UPI0020C37BD1|nr:hypothetical protein [Anatilimnocola floriformis]
MHWPVLLGLFFCAVASAADIDLSEYKSAGEIKVTASGTTLRAEWPITKEETAFLVLEQNADQPLIKELGINGKAILNGVDPVLHLTVGSRDLSKQGWNAFFDNPPRRPHETFTAKLQRKKFVVRSIGDRLLISISDLSAGKFTGELQFKLFADCRLLQATALLKTDEDACAILYDAGLSSDKPSWKNFAWLNTNDEFQRQTVGSNRNAAPLAVRHRTIIAEGDNGSLALFPPPHQFLYPLDFSDNFQLAWQGRGYRQSGEAAGFGVRQPPDGDGRFVPWMNAPPGSQQRLSVFYLLSPGKAESALDEVKMFTHGDRFPDLPGYKKFTSHYHVEHTLHYLAQQRKQGTTGIPKGLEEPGFVRTFKARGVDIVHLAEFHVGHSPDFIAQRLPQLALMHEECRRLSNDKLLLLPGEEPNVHLGGHWISLFPKPVYWLLHPKESDPFVREIDGLGKVYAVHNAAEVQKLMEAEGGLMWAAHPRTKSSFGFPDKYKNEPFYQSDRFLGAAWKALPADLSLPRLGTRALDLGSDMANWGQQKYLLGEVDVFQIQPDHELYGHMNVNYLQLEQLPKFDDGWQPVVDALRGGKFFVTTGEVLPIGFHVNEKRSGETLARQPGDKYLVHFSAHTTFPFDCAEIVWGDGERTHRIRKEIFARPFFDVAVAVELELPGVKWIRVEGWDTATNGAFTQPVWVK